MRNCIANLFLVALVLLFQEARARTQEVNLKGFESVDDVSNSINSLTEILKTMRESTYCPLVKQDEINVILGNITALTRMKNNQATNVCDKFLLGTLNSIGKTVATFAKDTSLNINFDTLKETLNGFDSYLSDKKNEECRNGNSTFGIASILFAFVPYSNNSMQLANQLSKIFSKLRSKNKSSNGEFSLIEKLNICNANIQLQHARSIACITQTKNVSIPASNLKPSLIFRPYPTDDRGMTNLGKLAQTYMQGTRSYSYENKSYRILNSFKRMRESVRALSTDGNESDPRARKTLVEALISAQGNLACSTNQARCETMKSLLRELNSDLFSETSAKFEEKKAFISKLRQFFQPGMLFNQIERELIESNDSVQSSWRGNSSLQQFGGQKSSVTGDDLLITSAGVSAFLHPLEDDPKSVLTIEDSAELKEVVSKNFRSAIEILPDFNGRTIDANLCGALSCLWATGNDEGFEKLLGNNGKLQNQVPPNDYSPFLPQNSNNLSKIISVGPDMGIDRLVKSCGQLKISSRCPLVCDPFELSCDYDEQDCNVLQNGYMSTFRGNKKTSSGEH